MPPITPAAWSSLITGVNPGKHGVFEWVHCRSDDYGVSPVTSNDRIGTPVWARLNAAGIRVGVVNIPLTYPAQALDGFLVCGFSTPDSVRDLVYPSELLPEIEAEFGPYQPTIHLRPNNSTSQELYAAEREHQSKLVRIAGALAQRHEVQVLVLNMMLLDHANHTMPTMGQVEQAIIDSDADLGWLLAEFAPDNVLLISDHGSSRVKGVFLLGAWLAEQGFLAREPRPMSQRAEVINYVLEQWLNGGASLSAQVKRVLLGKALSRLPSSVTAPTWRALEREVPLSSLQVETLDSFVPSDTQVYLPGGHRGNFSLNMVGREPEGVVTIIRAEAILTQLSEALQTICDPETGEPVFSALYRPEELYTGPLVGLGPDLIGDYYQSNWSMRTNLPGLKRRSTRYFLTGERWYGDHSRDGIYVFAGRDFRHNSTRGRANLLDIPATLLYLYDVPQPDDYDGCPLVETFANSERPIRYQPGDERRAAAAPFSYNKDEEREVLQRLSDLGYVD
jgi:predicted AlkP superfamily phosphohydrolase/phosphomutase